MCVNFILQKFCLWKRNNKYQVCGLIVLSLLLFYCSCCCVVVLLLFNNNRHDHLSSQFSPRYIPCIEWWPCLASSCDSKCKATVLAICKSNIIFYWMRSSTSTSPTSSSTAPSLGTSSGKKSLFFHKVYKKGGGVHSHL